ncbi:hypothetical protein A54_23 [Septuagintavirus sv54]|uniref:Uncharacterized protein n=1 Tax=Escherichia phage A5-4 TaxID=2996162 RepID=A0AAE9Q1W6_9CAUD|nr:hypothetical protein A54_23 [Escherichia phage A5-4]
MMFDIVKFMESRELYFINRDSQKPEVFRAVDGILLQSPSVNFETIELALQSGTAMVAGKAKVTIEISLT